MKRSTSLVLVALSLACGSGGRASGGGIEPASAMLTGEEIRASTAATAYDAVRLLRAHWLRQRGVSSIRNPEAGRLLVYLDGVRYGELRALEGIRAEDVFEMRYLSGPEATLRYGTGHGGGVIEVRTR